PVYRALAQRLAEEGYVVLIVHFFERTGHDGVDRSKITEEDFRAWMDTLADGVKYARKLKQVDKDRVGLLGFSLGGFVAVAVAAEETVKVQAVGCYFGGVPDELWPRLKKLPPLLVVHGGRDDIVPVRRAYALIGFCQTCGLVCEHKI